MDQDQEITIEVGGETLRPRDVPRLLFQEAGIRPVQGAFTTTRSTDENHIACAACLLGAIAAHASSFSYADSIVDDYFREFAEMAGITAELAIGLSDGWEEYEVSRMFDSRDYHRGYAFGKQAHAACLEAGMGPIDF